MSPDNLFTINYDDMPPLESNDSEIILQYKRLLTLFIGLRNLGIIGIALYEDNGQKYIGLTIIESGHEYRYECPDGIPTLDLLKEMMNTVCARPLVV